MRKMTALPPTEQIINLNVGGHRFATSRHTLTWITDSFFTSLLSNRIPTVRDETGAIFIDRDPGLFRIILNYLRTKQVDISTANVVSLKHEAQYYGLGPLVKRLSLCEELDECACGNVLFHAYLPAPALPQVDVACRAAHFATMSGVTSVSSSIISSNSSESSTSSHSRNSSGVVSPLLPSFGTNNHVLSSSVTSQQAKLLPTMEAKFQDPLSVGSRIQNHPNSPQHPVSESPASSLTTYNTGRVSTDGKDNSRSDSSIIPQEKSGLSRNCCQEYASSRPTYNDQGGMNPSGYCSPLRAHQGHIKKSSYELTRQIKNELTMLMRQSARISDQHHLDPLRVRVIRAHHNSIAVGYANFVCCYRMKESLGWQAMYTSPRTEATVRHVALNTRYGPQSKGRMLAIALANNSIHLWNISSEEDNSHGTKVGTFSLSVPVDKLFFIGNQLVALSKTGKVGIWHSMTHNWQVQDVVPISCYDTAGSFLLLGCSNGSIYYIDMQKFPLRMKDNDLLITELYHDPNADVITAISVYLTPKTNVCGNWIEIAYGTSSGSVRVIVQHPETVGHGPQLFQTYTVHTSPITRVALTTNFLISVCSEYNHVRSWIVTRFRGMISTQPGSTSLASFKVLTLDSTDEGLDSDSTDPGPFGDQDGEQLFVQRIVPDTNLVFVRLASNGDRLCTIRSVDGSAVSAFLVHECEGSSRMGARPRRYLFTGTSNGTIQMWDLTTALDQYHARISASSGQSSAIEKSPSGNSSASASHASSPSSNLWNHPISSSTLQGPTPEELLQLIDECEICCTSLNSTPNSTPRASVMHLPELDVQRQS